MKSRIILTIAALALVVGVAVELCLVIPLWYEANRMATVFVATEEIRQGTVITNPEKLFVLKQFPVEAVPPNAITDIRQLRGMQAIRTLDAGAICTQGSIGKFEPMSRSPGGLHAMSVRVHLTQPVPVPGSRVDVLAMSDKGDPSGKTTKVVLRNILVLATDKQDGATTVTLGVTPPEVEKLVWYADSFTLTIRQSKTGEPREN